MRLSDWIGLAFKEPHYGWAAFVAAAMAAGTLFGSLAGAMEAGVQREEALACELIVPLAGQEKKLYDGLLEEVYRIPEVEAVSPVIEIPVELKTGIYSAKVALLAIERAYLSGSLLQGQMFPSESAMPYLVLNDRAFSQFFAGERIISEREALETDWLSLPYSLEAGGSGRALVSKVCGIAAGDGYAGFAGYMSLDTAKSLLVRYGGPKSYTALYLRAGNDRKASEVIKSLSALGLSVKETYGERHKSWKGIRREAGFYFSIGGLCFGLGGVGGLAWRKSALPGLKSRGYVLFKAAYPSLEPDKLLWFQLGLAALTGVVSGCLLFVMCYGLA